MMIYQTQNYNLFDRQHANRPVNSFHVKKLADSMKRHGFLESYHIVVTPNMEVVDGQHRLLAAQCLDIPVFYTIQENIDIGINRELNVTNRKWRMEDYVDSYATDGFVEYQKLKTYMQESGLSLTVFTSLSHKCDGGKNSYKSGRYTFPTDKSVLIALEIITHLKKYCDFSQSRQAVLGLLKTVELNGFNEEVFLQRLQTYPSKLRKSHSTATYHEMYLELYNHNTKKQNNRIGG
jgi:hypothetical protein